MNLLPASAFTFEELTEIYNETRIDYIVPMPMSVDRMIKYVTVYDVDLDASVVAVEENDYPFALCMLGIREERAWITRLGVSPNTRRRGAGYAMMTHVIEEARLRGVATIYLEVITGNEPALKLFDGLGFEQTRVLKILRRPPGAPQEAYTNGNLTVNDVDPDYVPEYIHGRSWRAAWTNQAESLVNAGGVRMIHLVDHVHELSGWVTFKVGALQLQRVIIGADDPSEYPPAYHLLHELHSRYPALDTVAENVPADSPFIDAFYDHGYVDSFSRIEMELVL